jgi:four helix bundle protein
VISEPRSHRDLIVWHRAIDFVELIYRISRDFPADERFGLTSQIRRVAVSIASNIAEGAARKSTAEYGQFVSIALGSAAEVETQLEIVKRLSFDCSTDAAFESVRELIRMLSGLRQTLANRK